MSLAESFTNELLNSKTDSPRRFIIGSDWWTDCDDVMAMQILCWAHNNGIIRIEGVSLDACNEHSVASVCAFLESYGVDVPIGIDKEATDFEGVPKFQKRMAPFAKKMKCNDDAENAVRLYRRILAAADEKIEIIEIGFMQVLAALLESGADDISPMTGLELVSEKVKKFWIMAGKWDEQGGLEHNFNNNKRASVGAEKICRMIPCEVTFLGFEIGEPVISGAVLKGSGTFTAGAMADIFCADGRNSWDPMLVVLAICGDEKKAGYSVVTGKATVDADTGANYFAESADGKHKYVVCDHDTKYYSDIIDNILLR